VPMVVFGAGVDPGRVVDVPVQTLDLFPTLLEAAGVPVPPGCRGSSLWPLLGKAGEYGPHPIVAEAWADPAVVRAAPVYAADYRCVERDGRKLVVSSTGDRRLSPERPARACPDLSRRARAPQGPGVREIARATARQARARSWRSGIPRTPFGSTRARGCG
jgi:arylsulfatase A-like enzyme